MLGVCIALFFNFIQYCIDHCEIAKDYGFVRLSGSIQVFSIQLLRCGVESVPRMDHPVPENRGVNSEYASV